MTAALIIGQEERDKIAALRAFAAAPLDATEMIQLAAGDKATFRAMMDAFTIDIPFGYQVTYSLERQPSGLFRHISVSVDRPNKVPHPESVNLILEAFGMQPLARSFRMWIEDIDPETKAINVVQPA